MKILIAEDDPVSRRVLESLVERWGHEAVVATDGTQAWEISQQADAPNLMILDWMMPGIGGVELCQRIRESQRPFPAYILLQTARAERNDIVTGLEAGADDYVTKPFDREELRARVKGGVRVLELQFSLAARVRELEEALARVRQLQGLLPICSYCKKIRDDQNYWEQLEMYISRHSEAQFSHGICPECYEKYVKPDLMKWDGSRGRGA
jgi:DNA-binding response OmpR family regulator